MRRRGRFAELHAELERQTIAAKEWLETVAPLPVLAPARIAEKSCAKCGKVLGRGAHFHTRACKGLTNGE